MNRELNANYVRIDESKSIIEVSEKEPRTWLSDFALKDVKITFKDDTTIEITGQKIEWSFGMQSQFVEDMKTQPSESHIHFGYKNIVDFFKGIKKPFVKSGWYKLEKTTPYHSVMSKWYVVL